MIAFSFPPPLYLRLDIRMIFLFIIFIFHIFTFRYIENRKLTFDLNVWHILEAIPKI